MKPKSMIEKALEEQERFTPEVGFNVVVLDDFEPPGKALSILERGIATEEEAIAIRDAFLKENPGSKAYVYGPRGSSPD